MRPASSPAWASEVKATPLLRYDHACERHGAANHFMMIPWFDFESSPPAE